MSDLDLFLACMRVDRLYSETIPADLNPDGAPTPPRIPSPDVRLEGLDPYGAQTQTGLFLSTYGRTGAPTFLHTPWGRWSFRRREALLDYHSISRFMRQLTTRLYRPADDDVTGTIYALLAVEDEMLPEPQFRASVDDFLNWEEAVSAWRQLAEQAESDALL